MLYPGGIRRCSLYLHTSLVIMHEDKLYLIQQVSAHLMSSTQALIIGGDLNATPEDVRRGVCHVQLQGLTRALTQHLPVSSDGVALDHKPHVHVRVVEHPGAVSLPGAHVGVDRAEDVTSVGQAGITAGTGPHALGTRRR